MSMSDTPRKPIISPNLPSKSRFMVELLLAWIIARLPWFGVPFKWLESYFHEISHAIATVISGGSVANIQLFLNGAGFCFSQGGNVILIGLAGYLGAALWGGLLFYLATWMQGIRLYFGLIAGLVFYSMLLWARDPLTIIILSMLCILFCLPLKFHQNTILVSLLRVIALVVVVNAINSPTALLGITGQGDADILAANSIIPSYFWVALWWVSSLFVLYLCWLRIRPNNIKRNK